MSGTAPSATGALAGFTDFAVADGGLTVEMAGADNFIAQDIAPAAGATQAEVRFKGPHAVVVTGAVTVARAVVDGGRTSFATAAPSGDVVVTNGGQVAFCGQATDATPLKSLSMDGASLLLAPGETVVVAGDVALSGLSFALADGFAVGDSASLVVKGTIDEASIYAWRRALVYPIGSGTSWNVDVSSDGGVTTLSLSVVQDDPIVISVDSGADVRDTNVMYSVGTTLRTDVAAGAELRLDGDVGLGSLHKTGAGKTTLASDGNEFVGGVILSGGTLSALSPLALGLGESAALILRGGTLEIGGSGEVSASVSIAGDTVVSVPDGGDVSMPLPAATAAGTFFKRGAGRLVLDVNADANLNSLTNAVNGGAMNACEGELVLRGSGATPTVTVARKLYAAKELATHPASMTLDNVYLLQGTTKVNPGAISSHRDFEFACVAGGSVAEGAGDPLLCISNKAVVQCDIFNVASGMNNSRFHPRIVLDDATIWATWEFNPNCNNYHALATNYWTLRNGAKIYTSEPGERGRFFCTGSPVVFDCSGEGTTIARNAAGSPMRFAMTGSFPNFSANMSFSDGAKFCCWYIGTAVRTSQAGTEKNNSVNLTFDRGEWYVGGDGECVGSSNMTLNVYAKTGGLRLNPPANATWRAYVKVQGPGAIVKGGAGTLLMDRQFKYHAYQADTVTMAYAGRTEVLGGTMSIVSGAMSPTNTAFLVANGATLDLQGAAVSGLDVVVTNSAAISDAALTRATFRIAYDASTSSFAQIALSDVSTSGRTTFDFGRGEGDPLPREFEGAQVGTWTGTKPDVSRWRGVNGGNAGIGYRFVATDDGRLLASSAPRGFLIYVL